MFAKLNSNNQILSYPVNPALENMNVSFPENWNGGTVGNNVYVKVNTVTYPTSNIGWTASEITPIYNSELNHWEQSWQENLLTNEEILAQLANYRYEKEVAGTSITLANNSSYIFHTDRESQTKYIAALLSIMTSPDANNFSIQWKTKTGEFITLNVIDMQTVIYGVRNYVNLCFEKEAYYINIISTSNTEVLQTTVFENGWPT